MPESNKKPILQRRLTADEASLQAVEQMRQTVEAAERNRKYEDNKNLMLRKNPELASAYYKKRKEFIKQWQDEKRSKGGYLFD